MPEPLFMPLLPLLGTNTPSPFGEGRGEGGAPVAATGHQYSLSLWERAGVRGAPVAAIGHEYSLSFWERDGVRALSA
ncbi:hypothetical protein BIY31_23045 [Gibbsiella quercinecans]|nr:hypothetical protein BIY31_23045 [Gibbsiella quercinecans]